MATTTTPVVFIHGLWLHADSWSPWADLFREHGYEPVAPGWPGDGGHRRGDAERTRSASPATASTTSSTHYARRSIGDAGGASRS